MCVCVCVCVILKLMRVCALRICLGRLVLMLHAAIFISRALLCRFTAQPLVLKRGPVKPRPPRSTAVPANKSRLPFVWWGRVRGGLAAKWSGSVGPFKKKKTCLEVK